jgi:hypothetical protein
MINPMSMRNPVVLAALFLLGGCYSYRSVTGRVYGPNLVASDAALLDSGSTNLHCAPSQIRERYIRAPGAAGGVAFATGVPTIALGAAAWHPSQVGMLIAEGCGQRAVYVEDCSRPPSALAAAGSTSGCSGGGIGSLPDSCVDHSVHPTCELILVSKVAVAN